MFELVNIVRDMDALNSSESDHLLLFGMVPGIGQGRLRKLILIAKQRDLSLSEIWERSWIPPEIGNIENFDTEIKKIKIEYTATSFREWLKSLQIRVVFAWEDEYPYWLKMTDRPPVVLFWQGNQSLFHDYLPIAIVGNRAMTAYGRLVTQQLTKQLVYANATIVSGFMYGVDITAHQTAIEQGGRTVAVLGFGLNQMFPDSHWVLKESWLKTNRALFISPFYPQTEALRANFPIRNTVVAGMSVATVVTEAAKKSGSHITAQFALDFNRVVCAVPGPISNPNSEGTKWLINQGACMVSSGQDVLAEIREAGLVKKKIRSTHKQSVDCRHSGLVYLEESGDSESSHSVDIDPFGLSPDQKAVVTALKSGSMTFDQLLAEFNLPVTEMGQILSYLEMQGLIEQDGENYVGV